MLNPKDKLFYDSLSKGATGTFGVPGWVLQAFSNFVRIGAIGLQLLVRKRQGFFEFIDYLLLAVHIVIVALFTFPSVLSSTELWNDPGKGPIIYMILVVIAFFYHSFEDFRYPPEGLEFRRDYRGRTIFSKPYINEYRDMRLRLYDPVITGVIGFSLLLTKSTNSTGWMIIVFSICLLLEDLTYNRHIESMRRNLAATDAFANLISGSENKPGSRPNSQNDDDFEPIIPD